MHSSGCLMNRLEFLSKTHVDSEDTISVLRWLGGMAVPKEPKTIFWPEWVVSELTSLLAINRDLYRARAPMVR